MLISTESMHSALLFSMKPMPPMSAATLYTSLAPSTAASQSGKRRRSSWRLSTSSKRWYQSASGFASTLRIRVHPSLRSLATKCPPMNPPPPATTISVSFTGRLPFLDWGAPRRSPQ